MMRLFSFNYFLQVTTMALFGLAAKAQDTTIWQETRSAILETELKADDGGLLLLVRIMLHLYALMVKA